MHHCRSSIAWSNCKDRLIILDEIQQLPELFPVLRSLVDERRVPDARWIS